MKLKILLLCTFGLITPEGGKMRGMILLVLAFKGKPFKRENRWDFINQMLGWPIYLR
jgi:hypothetical protein